MNAFVKIMILYISKGGFEVQNYKNTYLSWLYYFLKDFIYLFLERWKEREREKHQSGVASYATLTGDLAQNLGMRPDWELNPLPFDLHAGAQPLSHTSQGYLDYIKFTLDSEVYLDSYKWNNEIYSTIKLCCNWNYKLLL